MPASPALIPPEPPGGRPQGRLARWLPGLALAAMVLLSYARVWHCGFIWDDDDHLTNNPCIIGPLGFSAIWTSAKAVYYPLVLTSFWVQHAVWGLDPLPYHVVDVVLHAACGVLLWRVLRRLEVPGAWLGAALWALHPVQVESAAWITEQKNTQSGVFYLLAILFFLRWREAAEAGPGHDGFPRSRRYGAALLFATLAILSKSSTVMLPVVLGLCWWWRDRRWRWEYCGWLAPFFTISGAASLWTIWEQKYANHALGAEWSQTWAQRAIVAGKDVWFYLWKLAWPHPLTFIYPVWNTDAARVINYVPLAAVIVALVLLWLMRHTRHTWLSAVFFAASYFVVSLFPVLSFFNVYFFRYSFVGDHFQYLASMGPLALAGAGIALAFERRGSLIYPVLTGALLLVLAGLTYLQCAVYYNLESLWRSTLADNPDAWIAQFNLAGILVGQGHLDEAMDHYQAQLQLMPDSVEARGNMANVLLMEGKTAEAVAEFNRILQIDPSSVEAHAALSTALLQAGRIDDAIAHAQAAVDLSRHVDENGEGHNDAQMLRILAMAYYRAGRYNDAILTARMALQRAQSQRNAPLATTIDHELTGYEAASLKNH